MRDETRHPITFEIAYTIEEELAPHEDMVKNISEGGLCLITIHDIQVGTELSFFLTIGNTKYELEGFSVWKKDSLEIAEMYEVGVQFTLESLDLATSIVQLICDIHDYQRDIEIEEGRHISLHEAALEFNQGTKGNIT